MKVRMKVEEDNGQEQLEKYSGNVWVCHFRFTGRTALFCGRWPHWESFHTKGNPTPMFCALSLTEAAWTSPLSLIHSQIHCKYLLKSHMDCEKSLGSMLIRIERLPWNMVLSGTVRGGRQEVGVGRGWKKDFFQRPTLPCFIFFFFFIMLSWYSHHEYHLIKSIHPLFRLQPTPTLVLLLKPSLAMHMLLSLRFLLPFLK